MLFVTPVPEMTEPLIIEVVVMVAPLVVPVALTNV